MPAFDHRLINSLDPRLWQKRNSSNIGKNGRLYLREGGPYRDLAFHKILLIEVVACVRLFSFLNFGGTFESVIETYCIMASSGTDFPRDL